MASYSTFSDTFSGTTLNSTLWVKSGDPITVGSNQLTLSTTSVNYYSGLSSKLSYDLSNTRAYIEIISVPTYDPANQIFPSFNLSSFQLSGGYGEIAWHYDYTHNAWAADTPAGSKAYAPTGVSMWLSIRNTGGSTGSVFWEWSSDGVTWTSIYNTTMAALQTENFGTAIPITALYYNVYVNEGSHNDTFVVAYANTLPPAPVYASTGGLILFL